MKKLGILLIVMLPLAVFAMQKEQGTGSISDKMFFGGGIGLGFGTYTAVEISPLVGYKPVENLYLGVKGTYQYYANNNTSFNTSIYGGSLFGTYILLDKLVGYAEYEVLSVEKSLYTYNTGRVWVGSPIVGGGYSARMGGKARLMILALWSLNDNIYAPYSNPMIRVSVMF